MVTGIDLVIAQLRVAQGEELGPEFAGVEPRGHAIEARIYAEDPYQNFAPSPGRIEVLRLPDGPGVRNDCGVYQGAEIPIHYDPMVAKMVAWGRDRAEAIARLDRALAELRIDGVRTTAPLFRQILADADFRAGRLDNGMLDRKLASGEWGAAAGGGDDAPADLPLVAAAIAHAERQQSITSLPASEGGRRGHWRTVARREAVGGGRSWS